jgi:hypothetical protein
MDSDQHLRSRGEQASGADKHDRLRSETKFVGVGAEGDLGDPEPAFTTSSSTSPPVGDGCNSTSTHLWRSVQLHADLVVGADRERPRPSEPSRT